MQAGTAQDAIALAELQRETDVTSALGAIHVPTLVIVRGDLEAERSRYAVERIPGAKVIVQPGPDMVVISGDTDSFLNEVENFIDGLRGSTAGQDTDRILSTLLFTDVVDSTSRAVELGDREWGALITRLHDRAESIVHRFRGRVVDTAGDGMLAAFDGTGRAIRCARELVDNGRELELEIRAGVHTGECQVVGERLRGVAVHVAARVAALAGASEVLVSSTVRDLVAGSGFEFADRGEHQLKGVPGAWRVFAADGARQA
jgi:class 3 adenylate cyclase